MVCVCFRLDFLLVKSKILEYSRRDSDLSNLVTLASCVVMHDLLKLLVCV